MENGKATGNKMGRARITMILAMTIFGTIGIARRYISLSSGMLALTRGIIGTLFLIAVVVVTGRKLRGAAIRKNLLLLLVSGAFIGANWIMLFEAYRYTSVATATLCYYLAPVFVVLISPIILREKLTLKKLLCAVVALAGMILVSGILKENVNLGELKGILFGVGAAVLYACVVIMNQKFKDISAYEKTIMQLGAAAVTLLPYVLMTESAAAENTAAGSLRVTTVILVLVVGIVHTGIAYALYFGSMSSLNAQTVAIFSYIDPVVAIILSAVVLREPMGLAGVLGACMILGSTLIGEIPEKEVE